MSSRATSFCIDSGAGEGKEAPRVLIGSKVDH